MTGKGLFISFEGIDGAGKSSHIDYLAETFIAHGHVVTRSREPGGTPLAEQLRSMVLSQEMDALTEALVVFAARRDHVRQVIAPALQRGEVVLCDRFADASFAYQGAGRGVEWGVLQDLERWVVGDMQPDITFWFDVPPAVAAQRLARARQADRFEAQSQAFFAQVVGGYERRMQESPGRLVRINADQTMEQVRSAIRAVVDERGLLSLGRA